jgi:hypothetical protein
MARLKVIVFSWKLLLQRLPIRVNLSQRGVLGNVGNPCCVWCPEERETEVYIFGTFRVALAVWSKIINWFGLQSAQPSDLCSSFESFGFPFNIGKNLRKGLSMIWHTMVWSLWKARNTHIFEEKVMSIEELFETIKHVSFRWSVIPCSRFRIRM